jgi:hypothetical protein
MKMIQETVDGENYLELVMHIAEAKSLLERKIVCLEEDIAGELYQIGVRTGSTRELEEDHVPLIFSSKAEAISKNIEEMVDAGHPRKQAVAAALSTADRAKGKKVKKSKQKKGA